ncbi:hypothetical protein [Thiorhodovibrio frisius]|uniref:Glycosyl transferase, UDP-glucuronosyltransferase n=1 Tax=Thiorhodovibrio frisius TaxID=631362 RepID=H8Z6C6_9GAMM|nr:hypothetical protein [Thiorhodovibrio frisius]EIC20710.1 hypothetical protein Thi970DRAFT_04365 [Thiorhodovibrio frisius]WPL21458.1 hypothetical protein Thiofri_01583 [Thiorhodovibrio frisius]
MAHLYLAVTAHGYGHLAQVAPVVHALKARLPRLRISLQGNLKPEIVRARLPQDVALIPHAADVALPMDGPLTVCWEQGLALYEAFEADYDRHLAHQMDLLADARPDLVLADIPWLPLDAAHRLGIPAVGLCSLNWLDILRQSPLGDRLSSALVERLHTAYAGAELFIRPAPSMPMPWLPNAISVGPMAQLHPRDPERLRARLGLAEDQRLILMQFGGTGSLHIDPGPLARARLQLLTADPKLADSSAVSPIGGAGPSMLEALASCDAMITKPGYGSFSEAACHGIPVLYVPRDGWPETPALVDWLHQQVTAGVITPEQLARGDMVGPIEALLEQARLDARKPVVPTGIEQTVERLLPWLQP